MSWKIDDIDLKTYHVGVSKATGVLDMPKMRDKSYDWLDLDGRDYWQPLLEIQYHDKEIILNCWIKAASEAQFQSRLNDFYTVLKAPGKRTLTPPYGDPVECFVDKQILIDRRTKYVINKQVGLFVLRFTVPGDPDFHELEICRTYSYNIVATVLTNNLKVFKNLQGEMYATCSFETNEKLDIQYFDHIYINTNGENADIYHINTEPEFRKVSTNKYIYNVRFDHVINLLTWTDILDYNNEADFYFYGNLEEIIDLIVTSHQRTGYNKFHKGSVAETVRKNHKFTSENCLSVLRRLCSEYELEYEFEPDTGVTFSINVKDRIANNKEITLEYGKGNSLYELTREPMLHDELCTVLFAYGSTKNLKPGYRGGLLHLSFSGNPLKENEMLDTGWGHHEHTVFFDEIYPRRTATVTGYLQKLPDELTVAEKYKFPEGIYKLTDSTLDFDLNEYLLEGLTAKVRMKTGDLAGFEFEIRRYDDDTKEIFLIPFKDERGEVFPNDTLMISVGDEYTLIDIDQPESYITAAESELAAAAAAYLAEHCVPKFPYRCTINPAYIDENPTGFEVGDTVNVLDVDYGIDDQFRVSSLTYDVYKQIYELILSETAPLARRQQIELRLRKVERAVEDTKKDKVESMRKEKETSNELRNRLLDPIDDKLNLDYNVRRESVDPPMLAYDAGVPQFSLKNALVETNVDGDEDKVKVNAGQLVISNDPDKTLDRYSISKLKSQGLEYDPTRTWNIEETNFNLATKGGYWLYAKLDLTPESTLCELEVYEEHKEVKLEIEQNYIKFKLGHISDASSPRYACMLWGNTKNPSLAHVEEIVDNKIEENNNTEVTEIANNQTLEIFGFYKEAFLIENTTNTEETQLSSWTVINYNELVGNFKAVVVIRDKTTHAVVTLQNTFGFDYTDSANEVDDDNAIISDGTITLVLSVDSATKKLKAVVSNMPSNAKRIHFCFERCVLSERPVEFSATIPMSLGMSASLKGIGALLANISMNLGMNVQVIGAEEEFFQLDLNITDYTWDYIYLELLGNGTPEIHDGEGNVYNQNILDKDGTYTSNGIKEVKIYKGTISSIYGITKFEVSLYHSYTNNLDFSGFDALNRLMIVAGNQDGGIILPDSNNAFYFFYLKRVGFSGAMNLNNYSFPGNYLGIEYCSNITGVTLPTGQTFTELRITYCALTSLDLSDQTLSGKLIVSGNSLTSITLPSTNGAFTYLSFDNNDLDYIDFTSMPNCLKANNCQVFLNNNGFTAAEINHIFVDLSSLVSDEIEGGDYTGRKIWNRMTGQTQNSPPDSSSGGYDGLAAKAALEAKGFTIYT